MSARCSSATCLNGNCQGCRNGTRYCNDPRCYPNCPDCEGITSKKCESKRSGMEWGILIAIAVLALAALGLMLWGYFSYRRQLKAQEGEGEGKENAETTTFQRITTTNAQENLEGASNNRFFAPGIPEVSQDGVGDVLPTVPRADFRFPENVTVSAAEEFSVRPSVIDSTIRGDFPN